MEDYKRTKGKNGVFYYFKKGKRISIKKVPPSILKSLTTKKKESTRSSERAGLAGSTITKKKVAKEPNTTKKKVVKESKKVVKKEQKETDDLKAVAIHAGVENALLKLATAEINKNLKKGIVMSTLDVSDYLDHIIRHIKNYDEVIVEDDPVFETIPKKLKKLIYKHGDKASYMKMVREPGKLSLAEKTMENNIRESKKEGKGRQKHKIEWGGLEFDDATVDEKGHYVFKEEESSEKEDN